MTVIYIIFHKLSMVQPHFVKQQPDAAGYVVLLTLLIVGAVSISVTLAVVLLGLDSSRTAFALEQSYQAKALADACLEEALQQVRDSTPYTGTDSMSLGQGQCSYTVVSTGGTAREITAEGTVGTMKRKVTVSISAINPLIILDSWQEVADF